MSLLSGAKEVNDWGIFPGTIHTVNVNVGWCKPAKDEASDYFPLQVIG